INLENITTLLIDLDDTVYPADCPVWPLVRERIDLYLREHLGFPVDAASALRERLFTTYGTTLRGLQLEYEVDKDEYLDFVHAVRIEDYLKPDPVLYEALADIKQRKMIFTNANAKHATTVLECLGINALFSGIIDIEAIAPYCKPEGEAFNIAMQLAGEPNPQAYLFVDDNLRNLLTAQALGMTVIHVGEIDHNPVPSINKLADIQSLLDGFA
ncbi:MAG: pyrimidine 5'-nucleotidase, partial [Anaerolineaceae bacterium]|nr:pyrimidine 5'-nucleotidase [Anaerolineaceae bacterium]